MKLRCKLFNHRWRCGCKSLSLKELIGVTRRLTSEAEELSNKEKIALVNNAYSFMLDNQKPFIPEWMLIEAVDDASDWPAPKLICKCNGERLNCPVCEYLDFTNTIKNMDPRKVNWSEANKLMDEKFMAIKKSL